MSVYQFSSCIHIAFSSKPFPTKKKKKQIVAIYFFNLFGIYIPILFKNLHAEGRKFYISKCKKIYQFHDFYINVKAKLVAILWNCKSSSRQLNCLNLKRKLVPLWWHCRELLPELNKLYRFKLLKLSIRDIYWHTVDTFLT